VVISGFQANQEKGVYQLPENYQPKQAISHFLRTGYLNKINNNGLPEKTGNQNQ